MQNQTQNYNGYMPSGDSDNPEYVFSTIPLRLIVAIANGEIDAVELAKKELSSRGFDNNGNWVGFGLLP